MCEIFNVSRSGYYSWLNRPISERAKFHNHLDSKIQSIYETHNGNYGAPRIHKDLLASGVNCDKKVVANRMKLMRLQAKTKKKFKATTDSDHNLPVASNILDRDFSTSNINQKWVGDITYIRTSEGWLYLATVIDIHSRAVIGWSMNKTMNKTLVCNALMMALWRRRFPRGVIMHTDRGSQYCSKRYQKLLKCYGLICSMSRKGNCWDNSIAESFFKTLKIELVYRTKFTTREQDRKEIFKYIEIYYNQQRRHSAIDYRVPSEVEYNLLKAA